MYMVSCVSIVYIKSALVSHHSLYCAFAIFKVQIQPKYTVRGITYICSETNFRQLTTAHVQQTIFGKTIIEVCSPYIYASSGTFYVQIG